MEQRQKSQPLLSLVAKPCPFHHSLRRSPRSVGRMAAAQHKHQTRDTSITNGRVPKTEAWDRRGVPPPNPLLV